MLESKYRHRRIASFFMFLIMLFVVTYVDNIYLWFLTAILLIVAIIIIYIDRHPIETENETLINHVIDRYKRISYPPNYYGVEEDQIDSIVKNRLHPIKEEIGTTITAKIPGIIILILIIIAFSAALIAIGQHILGYDNTLRGPSLILISIDSVAKGALLDILESFKIDLDGNYSSEYYMMFVDLIARTCVSLIVVKYAIDSIKEAKIRRIYKKTMRDVTLKVDFFLRLNWLLNSWCAGIPKEHSKYIDSSRVINEIIIPFLWINDGIRINEDFTSVYERFNGRSMGHDNIEFRLLNAQIDFQSMREDIRKDLDRKK